MTVTYIIMQFPMYFSTLVLFFLKQKNMKEDQPP